MKKRREKSKRVSGVPADAKLSAAAKSVEGGDVEIWIGKDGAVYAVRMERVTYRLLGGR